MRPDKGKARDGKTWRRAQGVAAHYYDKATEWHMEHEHESRSSWIPNDDRQALVRGLMRRWNRNRSKKKRVELKKSCTA